MSHNALISNDISPSFKNKFFDMTTYSSLLSLPSGDLVSLVVFSYLMQLDQPLCLVTDSPEQLSTMDVVEKRITVSSDGRVNGKSEDVIFSAILTIDVIKMREHARIYMDKNPESNLEDAAVFGMDSFIVQVVPQFWQASQLFNKNISDNTMVAMAESAIEYAKECDFDAMDMYENLLVPFIAQCEQEKKMVN